MIMKDLAAQVAAQHPEIPAKKVRDVLKTAFAALHQELSTVQPGKVPSPLGAFMVAEKAKPTGETKRLISLALHKPKVEGEGAAA